MIPPLPSASVRAEIQISRAYAISYVETSIQSPSSSSFETGRMLTKVFPNMEWLSSEPQGTMGTRYG